MRQADHKSNFSMDQATPANHPEPRQTARIRAKVRDRAILLGQTRPAPLILIDALRGKGA